MLTDVEAQAAQASDRDYKLADANGLYLFVTRSGFKSWRMKYRFGGKEKRLTFGAYPEVSLGEARARRDEARALLRDNIDPGLEKQRLRAVAVGEEPLPLLAVDELPFDDEPSGYAEPPAVAGYGAAAAPKVPAPPVPPPPVEPTPPARMAPPPPPARPAPAPWPQEPVAEPTAAPEPAPHPPVAAEPDAFAGSRAVSLLKQAELAAERAAIRSRSARRMTIAVLALFGLMALALGWWLLSHSRGSVVAAAGGATVPLAAPAAPAPAAHPAAPAPAAHPAAPAVGSSSAVPPTSSQLPPPAAATPSPTAPQTAPIHTTTSVGDRADAPTVARHVQRGHHRHRHHKKHRGRHRHARHGSRATAQYSSSTGRTQTPHATANPSAQETYHATDVAAPRGAAIDPALDRAGRSALCLRAAYSASPGCAAVR